MIELENNLSHNRLLGITKCSSTNQNQKSDISTKTKTDSLCPNTPELMQINNQGMLFKDKSEFDIKPEEIKEVESITNSTILSNIGYGGFSTVKLIYSHTLKNYYAMKVVIYPKFKQINID